jgi:methionyl-tRNA synthetase
MQEETHTEISEEKIPEKTYITIDDFKKVEAKIGKVLSAVAVENSDKLIKFSIDFGEDAPRQILSAIREWYTEPEILVGKSMLFCSNLAPRVIRGEESNGMLMAVDGIDGAPVFLVADREVDTGSTMR